MVKAYVQYLDWYNGRLVEPCGDRAVFILDGRNTEDTWIADGYENNGVRRPAYPHFKIMKGDFRNSTCIYSTN